MRARMPANLTQGCVRSYELNPRFFISASTFGSRPRKLR